MLMCPGLTKRGRAGVALVAFASAACTSDAERCASEDASREVCEPACEGGDAASCHRLARILDEMVHLDPALAEKALERSCELGSASGCVKRRGYCGSGIDDGAPMSDAERACRDSYTQRACDLGNDLACRQLRMAEEKKQKEAEKKAAAEERK